MYKFLSRPTISWRLSCDDNHPRTSVVRTASYESDKSSMHASVIIGLLASTFSLSFVSLILFCGGYCKRSACGEGGLRVIPTVSLSIQLVFIVIVTILVWG